MTTKNISIGGVAAQAILLGADSESSVKETDLISSLKERFEVSESIIKRAIHFAILGNLLELRNGEVFLKSRFYKEEQ